IWKNEWASSSSARRPRSESVNQIICLRLGHYAVQRQIARLFVAEERGAHTLKGVPEPTVLFRLVRASGGRRSRQRQLTPLVGRDDEMAMLTALGAGAAGATANWLRVFARRPQRTTAKSVKRYRAGRRPFQTVGEVRSLAQR